MRASLLGLVCLAGVLAPLGPATADGGPVIVTLAFEPDAFGTPVGRELPFDDPPRSPPTPTASTTSLTLGVDATVRLAVDRTAVPWRLWADTDSDGAYIDEELVELSHIGQRQLGEVDLAVAAAAEGELPVRLIVTLHAEGPLEVTLGGHRRGEIVVGGRVRPVVLVDGNANLCFDEPDVDQVLIDVDGDGRVGGRPGSPDLLHPGARFRLGRRGYVVQVLDPFGAAIRVAPASVPDRLRTWPPVKPPESARRPPLPSESFEVLTKQFDHEKALPARRRVGTVLLIGRLGTPGSCALLRSIVLTDKHEEVRVAAVKSLGNNRYFPCGAPALLEMAMEGAPEVRRAAVPALHDMGHPDRAHVYAAALDEDDPLLVGESARYLAYSGSPTARRKIDNAIKRAKSPDLRHRLYVYGARNLADGPTPKVMSELARNPDPRIAHQALRDLYTIGHGDAHVVALEAAKERPVPRALAVLLIRILGGAPTREGVVALLDVLEDGGIDDSVRDHLIDSLELLRDEDAQEEIESRLTSLNRDTRLAAAQLLSAMPGAGSTRALVRQAAKERDPDVLRAILELLSDRADPEAVTVLIDIAKKKGHVLRPVALGALAQIGMADRKVKAFFLALLGSGDWSEQVFAVQAAGTSGDAGLCGHVLDRIGDGHWQVRVAVVEAAARLRCRQAVPVLIDRLAGEQSLRLRTLIGEVLFGLTAVNLYDDAPLWKKWWDENESSFRVPRVAPDLPVPDAGNTISGFYGIPIQSNRIVFVIDQSGSMHAPSWIGRPGTRSKESRWVVATQQLLDAIEPLGADSRVNVVFFDSKIRHWKAGLTPMTSAHKDQLRRLVEKSRPLGGTNIYDAIEDALGDDEADTIFLLTDGVPSEGRFKGEEEILRAVRRLNQTRRIAIHGIAIGQDSSLLRRLAAEHGGRYVRY